MIFLDLRLLRYRRLLRYYCGKQRPPETVNLPFAVPVNKSKQYLRLASFEDALRGILNECLLFPVGRARSLKFLGHNIVYFHHAEFFRRVLEQVFSLFCGLLPRHCRKELRTRLSQQFIRIPSAEYLRKCIIGIMPRFLSRYASKGRPINHY